MVKKLIIVSKKNVIIYWDKIRDKNYLKIDINIISIRLNTREKRKYVNFLMQKIYQDTIIWIKFI